MCTHAAPDIKSYIIKEPRARGTSVQLNIWLIINKFITCSPGSQENETIEVMLLSPCTGQGVSQVGPQGDQVI